MDDTRLRIGEAAKVVGVNPRAIRYYERCGLLKAGRVLSRYRIFEEQDLTRLKLVKQLRRLSFSIAEIKQVLPVLLDPSHRSQRTQTLKTLLERRLAAAAKHLRELASAQQELQAGLKRLSSNRKPAKDSCCEPFCGPETCESGLVQITGLKREGGSG